MVGSGTLAGHGWACHKRVHTVVPTPLTSLRDALRLGAACAAVGALAWTWELFARQVPSSPWHVNGFPSAIERLAVHAWVEAAIVFGLAPLAWTTGLAEAPRRARVVLVSAVVGTTLALAAMAYSARTGMLGLQFRDTSPLNHALLLVRLVGELLRAFALVLVLGASLRRSA